MDSSVNISINYFLNYFHSIILSLNFKMTDLFHLFPGTAYGHRSHDTAQWAYPVTEMDKLKYSTFRDFWEKGFSLTAGGKFGGHFLVYPGTILCLIIICHSHISR